MRTALFILLSIALCLVSLKLAESIERTDFPVYYYAARVVLDGGAEITRVYDPIGFEEGLSIEAFDPDLYFIYSLPVAYLFSPLGLLPYVQAKAVFIGINILAYFLAIYLLFLALRRAPSPRWYTLGALCLWFPFLNNLAGSQTNGLILLLVAAGAYLLSANRPSLCGGFLAAAALFKLFPLIVAMVAGIRSRRVLLWGLALFALSFCVPGAMAWFGALESLPRKSVVVGYTPVYGALMAAGVAWFACYALIVGGVTVIAAWKGRRERDACWFVAVGQAAAFLVMPVVEYHHLVLLAIPVLYLLFSPARPFESRRYSLPVLAAVVLVNLEALLPLSDIPSYLGTLVLWVQLLRFAPGEGASTPEAAEALSGG